MLKFDSRRIPVDPENHRDGKQERHRGHHEENADVPQIDSPLVVETGDELTPDEAERRRHAADRREDGEDVDDFRGRAVEVLLPEDRRQRRGNPKRDVFIIVREVGDRESHDREHGQLGSAQWNNVCWIAIGIASVVPPSTPNSGDGLS